MTNRTTMTIGSIAAIALIATLAGCAPTTSTAEPSTAPSGPASTAPSSEPSTAPSPSPSTEPETGKPELGDLVIGPHGLDTLKIGTPVPAASADSALVAWKPDWCLANGKVGQPYVGIWESQYAATKDQPYGGDYPFFVYTDGGAQSRSLRDVYVWSPSVKTAEGIAVGSTEAQVKAAYPKPDYVLTSVGTRMYVVDEAPGRMIIEVGLKSLGAPDVGKVLWIHSQRSTLKASSIYGTDGVGGCGA